MSEPFRMPTEQEQQAYHLFKALRHAECIHPDSRTTASRAHVRALRELLKAYENEHTISGKGILITYGEQ